MVALRYDPTKYADTLGGRTLPIPQGPDIQLAGHPEVRVTLTKFYANIARFKATGGKCLSASFRH